MDDDNFERNYPDWKQWYCDSIVVPNVFIDKRSAVVYGLVSGYKPLSGQMMTQLGGVDIRYHTPMRNPEMSTLL